MAVQAAEQNGDQSLLTAGNQPLKGLGNAQNNGAKTDEMGEGHEPEALTQ
jgi:hypothetical protein